MLVKSKITGFCAGFHLFAGEEIDLPDDVVAALGEDVETESTKPTESIDLVNTNTLPKAQSPVQDKMVKDAQNKSLQPDPSAPDQAKDEEDQEIDE
jgi:hypothetical protein